MFSKTKKISLALLSVVFAVALGLCVTFSVKPATAKADVAPTISDIELVDGVQLRLTEEYNGMRYIVKVNDSVKDLFYTSENTASNYHLGVVLLPTDRLNGDEALTVETPEALRGELITYNTTVIDGSTCLSVVLYNIPQELMASNITARAYIRTVTDGESSFDYTDNVVNTNAAKVASEINAKGTYASDDSKTAILNGYVDGAISALEVTADDIVTPTLLKLPSDGSKTVLINLPAALGDAGIIPTVEASATVKTSLYEDKKSVVVTGVSVGDASVTISYGTLSKTIDFAVVEYADTLSEIEAEITANGSFTATEETIGGKWITVDNWGAQKGNYEKLRLTVKFNSFENLGLNNFGSYPDKYPATLAWGTNVSSKIAFFANSYGQSGTVAGTIDSGGNWSALTSEGNGLLISRNDTEFVKYFYGTSDNGGWQSYSSPLETNTEYTLDFYTYLGGSTLSIYLGGNANVSKVEWFAREKVVVDTLTGIKAITDQGTTFTTSEENIGGQWITVDNWADIKANYTYFKITLEFNSFVNKDFSDLGYTFNGANYPAFVAYRPEGQSDWLAFVSSTYNTNRVVCGCIYRGEWTSPYGSGSNGLVITRGGSDYIDFRYTDNTDLSAWEDYFIGSGANAIDKGFETGVQYEFSFYSEMGANSLVLYLGTDTVIKSIEYVK